MASQQSTAMKAQAIGTLFQDVARNPDARFIYEAIDAANSLLSIPNRFIDPVAGLKCIPLKYCLYVIYTAVLLFKARVAGATSSENDGGVRRAIQGTILQLQMSSDNPRSLDHRYATSLRLLWRKSLGNQATRGQSRRKSLREPSTAVQDTARPDNLPRGYKALELDPLNVFSWRDLDYLGQYIANESTLSMTDGMLMSPEFC